MNDIAIFRVCERLDLLKSTTLVHTGWKVIPFDRNIKNGVDITRDIKLLEEEISENSMETNHRRVGKYHAIIEWMEKL